MAEPEYGTESNPVGTSGKIAYREIDLGDRVRIFYSDGSTEDVPKGRLQSGGSSSTNYSVSDPNSLALQRQQLAQNDEQFYQNMGYEKARFGIEQEQRRAEVALAEARNNRDFAAEQHWNQVTSDLKQRQFQLEQQKQSFDQYNTLATLASNPRNFVQTFFMNRGFQAPPDVARYGNTPADASQLMPFSQFFQKQMGAPAISSPQAQPSAPTYQNPVTSATGAQYPQGTQLAQAGNSVYGSSYQGLSGFDAATGKPRLSPNDPDAAGLMARNPGMYAMTSQEEAMKYLPQTRQFAKGGVLQMMGPHAVVDLITGKMVALAGEAGPEKAYFDGAAIIDPSMEVDPYVVDPMSAGPSAGEAPFVASGLKVPGGGLAYPADQTYTQGNDWNQTTSAFSEQVQQPTQMALGSGLTPQIGQLPQQFQLTPEQQEYIRQQSLATAQVNANSARPATTTTGTTGTTQLPPSIVNQPTSLPQTQNGATTYSTSAPTSNISPRDVAPAGTFGQPVPAQRPSYLAGEDFQGQSGILQALQASGAVPPFLQRLFAQGRGDATFGTNTPQRTDLPPDLPLISSLAWQQLSPSEQQAMLSFVSSLGVTPEDYLNLIQQFSPSGGSAQSPLFGNYATYSRQ
jgi:hypothetical protein